MNIFAWVVIGLIVGIVAKLHKPHARWMGYLLFGIIGAILGGIAFGLLLTGTASTGGVLMLGSVLTAAIGAALLLVYHTNSIR
jgi:uncharacterized membrane protein YeaQ/YmgE (transglycosylase-associated protein family)